MFHEVVVDVSDKEEIKAAHVGNIHVMDGATLDAPNLTEAGDVYISAGGHLNAPLLTKYKSMVISPNGGSFN